MPRKTTTWAAIALASALIATGPAAGAQTTSTGSPGCASTDTACRLDGLEQRLDYLIDLMERQRPDRPGRPGTSRSIEIPVNQSCGYAVDGCSTLAARLCTQGGFARGVPTSTTPSAFGTTLNRATCMD